MAGSLIWTKGPRADCGVPPVGPFITALKTW